MMEKTDDLDLLVRDLERRRSRYSDVNDDMSEVLREAVLATRANIGAAFVGSHKISAKLKPLVERSH